MAQPGCCILYLAFNLHAGENNIGEKNIFSLQLFSDLHVGENDIGENNMLVSENNISFLQVFFFLRICFFGLHAGE